nr:hypothetical protein [Azospirillum sp. 412522]
MTVTVVAEPVAEVSAGSTCCGWTGSRGKSIICLSIAIGKTAGPPELEA